MATVMRKGIELHVGPFSTSVGIESAISRPPAPVTVCLGQPGHAAHAPSPGRKPHVCDICGPITDYSRTAKALKSGSEYQIVDAADIQEISLELSQPFFEQAEFTPSPREQVEPRVQGGEKLYYLHPSTGGPAYAIIRSMVRGRPDMAFVGRFTPTSRSRAGLFELKVRGDALVLAEVNLISGLKATPVLDIDAGKHEAMAIAAVDALAVDFDESTYDLHYAERVAEAFAKGERVTIAGLSKAKAAAPVDDTELGAELARLVAVAKKAPTAKSVAAKKAVAAKKTTARKTAARKVA